VTAPVEPDEEHTLLAERPRGRRAPRSLQDAAEASRIDFEREVEEQRPRRRRRKRRRKEPAVHRTLFVRLLVTFLAVLAMYGALTQLLAYRLGANVLADSFQRQLSGPALVGLEDYLSVQLGNGADARALQSYLDSRYGEYERMTVAVYDSRGRRLAQRAGSPGEAPPRLSQTRQQTVAAGEVFREALGLGFLAVGPVDKPGPGVHGFVFLAAQPDRARTVNLIIEATWRFALPVFLLAVLTAYLGTASITDRLRRAEAAVAKMAKGDLSARIPVEAADEIGKVGMAFNRTMDLLEHTVRELEAVDENRRRLVADFAHELNTPLTNVLAYLETLLMAEDEGGMDDTTRLGFLQVAHDEAHRLAHLARDLETLTKLEAGRLALDRGVVDLSRVAVELARRVIPRAEQQGLTVHTDIEPGGELVGDRMRLEQVGMNLLENALRYTKEGAITVRVRCSEHAVRLEIEDTGQGIPEDDLNKVMDRFYRVDESRNRSTGGSGLGLAIVGGIVRRHGGRVEIASRFGEGTTVSLQFPREGTAADERAPLMDDSLG